MSIEQDTLSGCEVMPSTVVQLSPKAQMSERRLRTICAVIERPEKHCGDDLVFHIKFVVEWQPILSWLCLTVFSFFV